MRCKLGLQMQARRLLAAISGASVLAFSGCATHPPVSGAVTAHATGLMYPQNIYVYAFDMRSAQVKPDSGLLQRLAAGAEGAGASAAQVAGLAAQVQDAVANELVHKLQKSNLRAIRSAVPVPPDQTVLFVTGHFDDVDAGNRLRRVVVGLGAGKSQVSATAQIWYQPAGKPAQLLETFDTSVDSGHMPGMAETLGVGAAADRLTQSAEIGGGVHAISETTHAQAVDDADRLADSIAQQVVKVGVEQGWLKKD